MKKFKFKIAGNPYDVVIKKFDNGVIKMEVNGSPFKVEIEKEESSSKTPRLVRHPVHKPAGSHKIEKNTTESVIVTPLPGVIMSISVKEGDEVTKGQKLLIYEAMKMENNILAESDGVVAKIHVSVNDNVLQGDKLITIE